MRPRTVTTPAGGGASGSTARDARCAIQPRFDQHDAAVRERERRHDVIAGAAGVHLVVDEDLPRGRYSPVAIDRAVAQRRPIGGGGKARERDRLAPARGVELRAQRLLRVHPVPLPVAGGDADRHRRDRRERRQRGADETGARARSPARRRRRRSAGLASPAASSTLGRWSRRGMKIIVIAGLVAVIASLFSALYYLYHDRGHGTRMVKALAIRVALSAALVAFLVVSY